MVESCGRGFLVQHREQFLHVCFIDVGVAAARIVQGDGQARYGMTHQQGERLLQRIEAAHTDDGIDHTILDKLDDLGESLCYDTESAKLFGLVLKPWDVASATAVTEQSVGIKLGLTGSILAQAFRQHEQSSLMRDARNNG